MTVKLTFDVSSDVVGGSRYSTDGNDAGSGVAPDASSMRYHDLEWRFDHWYHLNHRYKFMHDVIAALKNESKPPPNS